MTLDEWEDRLRAHFEELSRLRSEFSTPHPVFALEHGLTDTEIDELEKLVRRELLQSGLLSKHSLAWTVYAAEIGYKYSGEEFWQTFAKEIPGWSLYDNTHRHWIQYRFKDFHKKYLGAKPSGLWAEHFSIICWPISHAILPRDLQEQLARVLYYASRHFKPVHFTSAERLGELIAAHSWYTTKRFTQFAEDQALLGQIAIALLTQKEGQRDSFILPSTLKRIVTDLERVQDAREWLRAARASAEKSRMRGMKAPRGPSRSGIRDEDEAESKAVELALEPDLLLKHSDDSWEVWLRAPDLSTLLAEYPNFRHSLAESRCTVTGSSMRPLWKGRVLNGPLFVQLHAWPASGQSLLTFEESSTELDYFLRTYFQFRPGPLWLFRIGADGAAYQQRSLHVRAGCKYLLLSTSAIIGQSDAYIQTRIGCTGIHGISIDVPLEFSKEWLADIRKLGLIEQHQIEVWPAGLAPVSWDGEGFIEWLTTDLNRIIGIRSDHRLEEVTLNIGDQALKIENISSGEATYVQLPNLDIGTWRVSITAKTLGEPIREISGVIDIAIRSPTPWVPGSTNIGPMQVLVDPRQPSLTEFWEERISLEIHGPTGRRVEARVSFLDRGSTVPRFSNRLPDLVIPVNVEQWNQQIVDRCQVNENAQTAYYTAQKCVIELSGEELGRAEIHFERDFTPIRWVAEKIDGQYELTLHDDRGDEQPLVVKHYSFENPDVPEAINLSNGKCNVPHQGGLFVAASLTQTQSIVISPATSRVSTFADLGVRPSIQQLTRSTENAVALIAMAAMWQDARQVGLQASIRRRKVLSSIQNHISIMFGGENWTKAEQRLLEQDSTSTREALCNAVSSKSNERGLGIAISHKERDLVSASTRMRVNQFSDMSRAFLANDPVLRGRYAGTWPWLSELAVRIASGSSGIGDWAGSELRNGVDTILSLPTLWRAARLIVRHVEWSEPPIRVASGRIYQGWDW